MPQKPPPITLAISGHDPTGGAGSQADIEAIRAMGSFPATLVTCLTTQNSRNVRAIHPQPASQLMEQLEYLLDDMPVAAIKIGLLGDAQIASALAERLQDFDIPIVLDPILAAGGGKQLAGCDLQSVIREHLLPLTCLLTPNAPEARRLSGMPSLDKAAAELLTRGCRNLLITGAHEDEPEVINRLYQADSPNREYAWPRLAGSYHGSGCTLAAAAAALLARGVALEQAVEQAQAFTWNSLSRAFRPGHGQWIPDRSGAGS